MRSLDDRAAKDPRDGLVTPADAQDLLLGEMDDKATEEVVDIQDPGEGLAGIDIGPAENDEVEVGRIGKLALVSGLVEG